MMMVMVMVMVIIMELIVVYPQGGSLSTIQLIIITIILYNLNSKSTHIIESYLYRMLY